MEFSDAAALPTRSGTFQVLAAREEKSGREHLVVIRGEVKGGEEVPVRLHSECLTGDVMSSLRCDCREQLEKSLEIIQEQGRGVLIYLRQEGRGIGLMNKIRAYCLQDGGCDTVEANRRLGFEDDCREYGAALGILKGLEVKSVALITNNPEKIEAVKAGGIPVVRRIPLVVPLNPRNESYVRAKEARMGHLPAENGGSTGEGGAP